MYDQEPVYAAVEEHSPGVRVIIPPRKDASLMPGDSPLGPWRMALLHIPSATSHVHIVELDDTG
jgi:hypothetical protein